MALISAPYENTLTAFATSLGELSGFLEAISPAFIALITNDIGLHKSIREQRILDRRLREITRVCRKTHLTAPLIAERVDLDFTDLSVLQKQEITNLLVFQLITSIVTK